MQRSAFIVLPFDLADPVTIIPDVLRVFAGFRGFAELGVALVLLPFNDAGRLQRLDAIVRDTRERAAWRPWLTEQNLFVARVLGFDDPAALARLFPVAIVDGCGPEAEWTLRRLRWFGLRAYCLVDPDHVDTPEEGEPSVIRIPCEDERTVRVLDRLGERMYAVRHPSTHTIADLLIAAAEAAHAQSRSLPAPLPRADWRSEHVAELLFGEAMVHG
jgi:hypothetical protein